MKFFFFCVAIIGLIFIADRTCPSYDRHYDYIAAQVFSNSDKPKDIGDFFVKNLLGSGFNTLQYTSCGTFGFAEQFEVVSICKYNDGRINFATLGIFDKIIVLK